MEYRFKTKPFGHQAKEFEENYWVPYRAILWEQGTGKTKLIIDSFSRLFLEGNIDGVIVLAPGGVHLNWELDEIPTHMPDSVAAKTMCASYRTKSAGTRWHTQKMNRLLEHRGLSVLCMSYDSFMTTQGQELVKDFLWKRKVFYVLDESGRIKNWETKRTQKVVASGPFAPYRRILNGTPVTTGPFDLFGQLRFLKGDFWSSQGLGLHTVFKKFFGVFRKEIRPGVVDSKGRPKYYQQLVRYKNLERMNELLSSISSRVTKADVLDLPEKLYTRRYFELTSEQERLYRQMASEYIAIFEGTAPCVECAGTAWVEYEGVEAPCPCCDGSGKADGKMVTAELAITRLLRLQQIISGFLPVPGETESDPKEIVDILGGNPRLELLQEVVEDLDGSFIVFARFTHDIELILERLAHMGISAVRYDGTVSEEQRHENKLAFQQKKVRAFVAYTPIAAEGLTLHAAKTVIYYSNGFSLHVRLQSEDRAHRIGQKNDVTYIDLCAYGTIDIKILDHLRQLFDIATKITGDKLREWLSDERN